MITVEQRYHSDPQFHRLVNMLEKFIHDCQFTPSELREAAIYAAILYETRRATPCFIYAVDDQKGD